MTGSSTDQPTSSAPPKLVLASGSSYRRELLERLAVEFACVPAHVDESRNEGEGVDELAIRLARDKARAIAPQYPESFVIGSDQVIALDGDVLHKPGTIEGAIAQLQRLSGRTHRLVTAVCVIAPHGEASEVSTHEMTMRDVSRGEIERYVAEDQPLDCAGAYKIEARGIGLFESLRGDDYTGIIGLPLTVVRRLLDQLDFDWDRL